MEQRQKKKRGQLHPAFFPYGLGFCLCIWLLLPGLSQALEVGGTFRFGNLLWNSANLTPESFTGESPTFGGSSWLKHEFKFQEMDFETEYIYDPVLRNIITTRFINKWDIFSFGVGPFIGMFNTDDKFWLPKLGVSAFFRVEWPGVLFVEVRLDNSTFDQLVEDGDYLQERSNLALGFYVPHAICYFNIMNKQFVQRLLGYDLKDSITEYRFATDIYKKNVPFKVLISFAYLVQSMEVVSLGVKVSQGSVILGLRMDVAITDYLSLILDTDSSIYSFGLDGLLGAEIPGWYGYLFRADVGFSLNITRIINKRVSSQDTKISHNY